MNETPSARPLVVRFGAMGDMVLITPLIRALSARYGTPVDILSNGPWTQPLLQGQDGVGTIHLLKSRKLPYALSREQRALVRQLKPIGARPTWYCDTDDRCLGLLARAGITAAHVCRSSRLPLADGEHLIDYWLRFGAQTPGDGEAGTPSRYFASDPSLRVAAEDAARLSAWLASMHIADRTLLLVQPGNKRTMRRGLRRRPSNTKWWPEAHWAAVIGALAARHPDAAILLLGVPQEAGLNDEILALAATPTALNVADAMPMPRLLALQARAAGMISVDTGPAHSAVALGCPVVVLFGVADPVRIRPRGGATPVRVLTGTDTGRPSMLGIRPDAVIDAWDRMPLRREPG